MDLNSAVEDTADANTVFEDLVDLHNSVVGLLRSTIRHVVYVKYHIRHLRLNPRFYPKIVFVLTSYFLLHKQYETSLSFSINL